jgi:MtN3 and saliva related transmembrane protein
MDFSLWTVVGIVAALLTSFSYVPQVIKMWRHKSAKDVSNVTILQGVIGCSLWLVYGISLTDFVIIGSNVVAITIMTAALVLYYRFHVKEDNH